MAGSVFRGTIRRATCVPLRAVPSSCSIGGTHLGDSWVSEPDIAAVRAFSDPWRPGGPEIASCTPRRSFWI